ncbi:sodium/proton antiporter, CPA1 family [Carnobacterium iners]|uniref:Sodium/proton antiporter, CPA1 family n=1 Tax=Carnobacterium iners TaxID=1073423 RepID=A0A1X7MTL2_9LACT|nr:cation:proton antiporter [Carnobacterium iners]SEL38449.1 sodium/proton antiporter, CPA1 family [Carnobacterium iners]SMH27283.1 sodium/proton antiporter, CPA1 family [Carnobacterium iners]
MLLSLALILIVGFIFSSIFSRLRLPGLLGLILTGIILGPYCLNLLDPKILSISADIRQIALIVILFRAGLTMNINDLKKNGRPAILMTFLPATFEIITVTILAPLLFGISTLEAAILGTVLGAVSPAIVVPRMIRLIESGYGKAKGIPQMILAGASVDDVFVIVLFTSFLGMFQGNGFEIFSLLSVPVAIIFGLLLGVLVGYILVKLFKYFHIRDTVKVLLILSICFLMVVLEERLKGFFPISGLLGVMALGGIILKLYPLLAKRINTKFSKIWIGAEVFLFVLVGSVTDITALSEAGITVVLLILISLIFRMTAVFLSVSGTNLTVKEKLFTAGAYTPKATVQAAIGSIPLAMGVPAGNIILTVAVLSIILTAPLGATFIDLSYKKLLEK